MTNLKTILVTLGGALLFCQISLASPPFYYGNVAKVINKDSVYYGCYGTVEDWANGGVVLKDLCGDYKRETFKDEELQLNRKASRQSDGRL